MENVTFENISKDQKVALINTNVGSEIHIKNILYNSSLGPFIQLTSSSSRIDNVTTSNIASQVPIFLFYTSTDAIVANIFIESITGSLERLVYIEESTLSSITNFQVKDLPYGGMHFKKVHMEAFEHSTLSNLTYGLKIESSNITEIKSCTFEYLGSSTLSKGGALWLIKSSVNILNSTISNNKAIVGGAIYVQCKGIQTQQNCNVALLRNNVHNNSAVDMGGGVYYDSWRPTFGNNTYDFNTAIYGKNIASYPLKIIFKESPTQNMSLSNIGNGVKYSDSLALSIIDYDNQEIANDDISQIKISPATPNATVKGIDYAKVTKGVGVFDNLQFTYKPGFEDIQFVANSKSIDKNLLHTVMGSNVSDNQITVDFRWCMPGEIQQSDETCRVCDQGTYSLEWNSTICTKCMENAVCLGGSEIELRSGYWRNSRNSTDLIRCPLKEACQGGYSESNQYPVECAFGYSGYLCSTCTDQDDGDKFMRVGIYECEKCPDPLYNAIRVFGFVILIFIFFIILVIINIRKKNESQMSILLRILTNYLQLLGANLSYGLNYPESIYNAFSPFEKVGSSSESFLSFDCFFTDSNIVAFTPSTVIFKLFLSAIFPAIAIVLIALFWVGFSYTNFKWCKDTKRGITVTVICLLFLMHPTLTNLSLTMFQCTNVGDGLSRMTIDMEIECFSSEHFKWALSFGLPMLVIWVIALPAVVLVILIKERKNLDKLYMKRYFLILYQGLKPQAFYWEFVNTLRKIIMPLFNVMLSRSSSFYQVMVAIIILILLFRLQQYIKPYKLEENNQIEILAVLTGTVTLFGALVFLDSVQETDAKNVEFLEIFSLMLIFLVNVYFILRWIHIFLYRGIK